MATQLVVNERDRIKGVLYVDKAGKEHLQRARVVCVAGNAIETPRLLLNSSTSRHPQGLANGSGQVGRNYMHHNLALAFGIFEKPVNMYRGITTPGTVFDEMGHDETRGFAGGYLIEAVSLGLPFMSVLVDPTGWGRDYAQFLESYDHMAGVLLNGEDMPQGKNRVSLHDEETDQYGLPAPVVHVEEHPNETAMRDHFFGQASELFEAIGARRVHKTVPLSATHNLGTCRMSDDPDTGVVNAWGRSHEIQNLFISDGSQFTTSTCENPTLTIVALGIRQADHIAGEMSRRQL
jgi:choline dehydrogenase-like flavoprotein